MRCYQQDNNLFIETSSYKFHLNTTNPIQATLSWKKDNSLQLFLIPQLNTAESSDDPGKPVDLEISPNQEFITITLKCRNNLWDEKLVFWQIAEESLEHFCRINSTRSYYLADITFLGTSQPQPTSFSSGNFHQVFSPVPNVDFYNYFLPAETAENPINAKQFRGGSWFFTPSPYFYALKWNSGDVIGVGILCKKGENNFSNYLYQGGVKGFTFLLSYDCATHIPSRWDSPHLKFYFGNDEFALLQKYCNELYNYKLAQRNQLHKPQWWFGPIWCGWGEQCCEAMRLTRDKTDSAYNTLLARSACNQQNYENWLKLLLLKDLKPRIVIIDDGWAEQPGSPIPHPDRWRNLRHFIDQCHQQNIYVLLWHNCFETTMAPVNEVILNPEGKPYIGNYGAPCADPTNPAFAERFKKIVYKMLSPDKDCLNADGFKVDINGSIPAGKGYKIYGNIWGGELMKAMMKLIYDSAKDVKEFALIESHTANAYFNDTVNMLRLNDMCGPAGKELEFMSFRYRVARCASPDWLIDTDCWPIASRDLLRQYISLQPRLGVPALYYAFSIGELPDSFTEDDYSHIRSVWEKYSTNIPK
ncbi:MAG: hypothetical protein N2246_03530 [Candidatus Sumerlaeia bacterium]|nr:hypothetical protein [Candidatus Sumerlaeia bacterium]